MVRLIYILMLLFLTGCFISNFPTKRQSLGFVHNPYGFTPLSAVYRLPNRNKKSITITVKGKTSDSDISYTYPAGYGNEFPIHGLYPDYENRIKITGQISTNITFKTPAILVSGVEPKGTLYTEGGGGILLIGI